MLKFKNRKAALELSIGTIVILVLAMTMLILGLILVRNIFTSATEAIGEIDKGVRDAISKAFTDPDKKLAIAPSTNTIEIKKGVKARGFAFSLRNIDIEDKVFTYRVYVDPVFDIIKQCKINAKEAESWLISDKGSITIGKGSVMENPELVLFNIPENAPPCTIPFKLDVNDKTEIYASSKVYLTVQSK